MISHPLNKLKPGMVLAEAVYNFQGVLLLGAGATLTVNNIRILKSWGVSKVSVEGQSEERSESEKEHAQRVMRTVEKRLREKFSDIKKDQVIMEIMRISADILQRRAIMEEGRDEAG